MANRVDVKGTLIHVGDVVRLHQKVIEGEKERTQIFEGLVIGIRGQDNKTFTVRKISAGNIGVERIFPVISPWILKVEIKKAGHVRRAKLSYVRRKSTKEVAHLSQSQSS
jgi:large subunit ribosomal protein L19